MPRKLSIPREFNLSKVIKQIEEKLNEQCKKVHKDITEDVVEQVKFKMQMAENLYYQYVRSLIDAMAVSSAEELMNDRSKTEISLYSYSDLKAIEEAKKQKKEVEIDGPLKIDAITWEGLAESTVIRKKKKGKRKPRAWVDTYKLYDWLRRQKSITKGSIFTGKLKDKVTIRDTIVRRTGKIIYNESVITYRSPLAYFRPTLPASLERKVFYNEKKRPLFEPVRKAFLNDLLPRKLENIVKNDKFISRLIRS